MEPRRRAACLSGVIADLYRAHMPAATRLAYLLTGDRTAAEDVAQDAFLRAASRLGALRDEAAFPAYLHRAVVNASRNRARRLSLERRHAVPAHEGVDTLPDLATRDGLWHALQRLPHRQRAALVLRFYLDLPEAEVAQRLGCRPGTV